MWVNCVRLFRNDIIESKMQNEEGEFEVLDAHETVKSLWMKKRVNLPYLQPTLGPAQAHQPLDLSVIKQETYVGTLPPDLSAVTPGPDLAQPSDLDAKKARGVGRDPTPGS